MQSHNPYVIVLIDGDGILVRHPATPFRVPDPPSSPFLCSSKVSSSDKALKVGKKLRMPCGKLYSENAATMPTKLKLSQKSA